MQKKLTEECSEHRGMAAPSSEARLAPFVNIRLGDVREHRRSKPNMDHSVWTKSLREPKDLLPETHRGPRGGGIYMMAAAPLEVTRSQEKLSLASERHGQA